MTHLPRCHGMIWVLRRNGQGGRGIIPLPLPVRRALRAHAVWHRGSRDMRSFATSTWIGDYSDIVRSPSRRGPEYCRPRPVTTVVTAGCLHRYFRVIVPHFRPCFLGFHR